METKRYSVSVEVRQHGAIGIFEIVRYAVDAASPDDARRAAFDAAQADGWETRGVLTPREVSRPPADE